MGRPPLLTSETGYGRWAAFACHPRGWSPVSAPRDKPSYSVSCCMSWRAASAIEPDSDG